MPDPRLLVGGWTLLTAHLLSGCQSQLVSPGPPPSSPPAMSVNPPATLGTPRPLVDGTAAAPASIPSVAEAPPSAGADELPRVPASAILNVPRAPESNAVYHEVIAGETLASIGRKYGHTAEHLRRANGLDEDGPLQPGQLVYIPRQ